MSFETSKLEVVASALYLADRPDVLAKTLNSGLNGNRVLRAVVSVDDSVVIETRFKPEDSFSEKFRISPAGKILPIDWTGSKPKVGSKILKSLENAISLEAVAAAEALAVPETDDMMKIVKAADFALDFSGDKADLGKLEVGAHMQTNAYVMDAIFDVAPAELLAAKMGKFNGLNVGFKAVDGDIVMVNRDGLRLATMSAERRNNGAVSIVAEATMTRVFQSSILALNASLDLISKLEQRRKEARETQEALWAEREAQRAAVRKQQAQDRINAYAVKEGETFTVRVRDYEGDILTTLIAERDLTAKDFLDILELRYDGLVREHPGREFYVTTRTIDEIEKDLKEVEKDEGGLAPF